MGPLAITLFLIVSGSILSMAWLVWTAPEGWEDKDGFHFGSPGSAQDRADQQQTGTATSRPAEVAEPQAAP